MASPGHTLGRPWIPLEIRPCKKAHGNMCLPSHVYPYPKEDLSEIFKWIKYFEKYFHVVVIGLRYGVSKGVIDGYRPPDFGLPLKRPYGRFRCGLPAGYKRVLHGGP